MDLAVQDILKLQGGPKVPALILLCIYFNDFIWFLIYNRFFSMKEFRGGIIRLFEQGKSDYQIAKDVKLPYTTVRDTIRRYRETGNYNDRPRSGGRSLPDLCVEDFSLWSILENEACSKPHQSIEVWLRHGTLYLKKSLNELWTTSRSVWRSALMPKVAILKINS